MHAYGTSAYATNRGTVRHHSKLREFWRCPTDRPGVMRERYTACLVAVNVRSSRGIEGSSRATNLVFVKITGFIMRRAGSLTLRPRIASTFSSFTGQGRASEHVRRLQEMVHVWPHIHVLEANGDGGGIPRGCYTTVSRTRKRC